MGFTLTNCDFKSSGIIRTPEKEAADKLNHDRMRSMIKPDFKGTDKQVWAANKSLDTFLFHAHAWGFKADDIESFLQTYRGKSLQFWISNKSKHPMSGETRIAVEKELEAMAAEAQAMAEARRTIAQLTPAQLNRKIGR